MAVNLSPVGGVAAQFFTNTGAVLTGGKIYTYAAGTTTPATTFTSSQGVTAWTNPIVLDAAGRVSGSGEIWLTDGINYKFVLKDSNDVLIATYDNISGINSNFVAYTNNQQIVTATAGQTVFNLSISYQPGTNSLSVFVDGVNQYGPGAQYAYTETDSDTVTFVSGLHVGAEVKFTTTQQQGAGAVNASQVTYNPAGTGAVATNVQAKLRESVSVLDYGAIGNGTTDDTAAIQAAITYAYSVAIPKVIFPNKNSTYLISSSISVPQGITLQGEGTVFVSSTGTQGFQTRILKASTMTTAAVVLAGQSAAMANIGVYANAGATGNGIEIQSNTAVLTDVSSNGHAGIGILIGSKVGAYVNCNSFRLSNIVTNYNGSHGLYISDDQSVYPLADANAGSVKDMQSNHNGGSGIYINNCFANTFINLLTESNALYGMRISNKAVKHTVICGDFDEGNTVGEFLDEGANNTFIGLSQSGSTFSGTFYNLLGYNSAFLWALTTTGLTVNGNLAITGTTNPSYGVPYYATSYSAPVANIDTGIVSYSEPTTYDVYINASLDSAGNNRNIPVVGILTISETSGFLFEISFTQIAQPAVTGNTPVVVTAVFWNGVTETTTTDTAGPQIRIKISGFVTTPVGYTKTVARLTNRL